MSKLKIPKFKSKKKRIAFIVENKMTLLSQKKSILKKAEGMCIMPTVSKGNKVSKTAKSAGNSSSLQVKAIINTTNVFDSHGDVHMPGLWKKSLKENRRIMHLQEHKDNEFDKIIASGDDLQAYTKTYTWKELGYELEGKTQALEFNSTVRKSRNPYMHNQYKKNYVDNHSVGMYYVKIELAVNDKKYEKEYAAWKKYIGSVVNAKDAEKAGMMWVVLEAKVKEGSAVPNGSNSLTPTRSVTQNESKDKKKKEAKALLKALKQY